MKNTAILTGCLCAALMLAACTPNNGEAAVNSTPAETTTQATMATNTTASVAAIQANPNPQVAPPAAQTAQQPVATISSPGTNPSVATESPQETTTSANNPFALKIAGGYDSGGYNLYIYEAKSLSYSQVSAAWLNPLDPLAGDEANITITAINNLPPLEKIDKKPNKPAEYGLMTTDLNHTKVQYFFYEDMLTVGDEAYALTAEQYATLKSAFEGLISRVGLRVPQWFVYMNPTRVVSIRCTDENGEMRDISDQNITLTATDLAYINIKDVKTYTPGSKALDSLPFKAVYTFDNGITYTVYVSDTTPNATGAVFYVESSDMSYACEYTADGYISHYIQTVQAAIDGPLNPRTM